MKLYAKKFAAAAMLSVLLTACSGLSDRAKQMTGNYYIPEISEDVALMELHGNGKCTIRAIRPGVLTYSVKGKWNVENDSLIVKLKPETMEAEGDSTLVGDIPTAFSRHVLDFNGVSLTLEDHGVSYVFRRRPE